MAAGLLLTSCSGGSSQGTAGPLEQTSITVDAFDSTDAAGLWIALQDGLFAREGLNVHLSLYPYPQPQVDNLVQGKADITLVDYVTYIENQTGGDPDLHHEAPHLEIIAEASFMQHNQLAIIAPAHSQVTSVASLKGKRISTLGANNIGEILVNSLLQDNGIPLRDEQFPTVQFSNVGMAFAENKMDAAFVPEPYITLLEQGSGAQEIADTDEGGVANFPIGGLATTRSWAQRNPNTLKAFLKAFREGQLIATTSRSEVEKALETYMHLAPVVAAVVSLPAFPQGVDPVRLQRAVNSMLSFGMLSKKFSNFNINSMIYHG